MARIVGEEVMAWQVQSTFDIRVRGILYKAGRKLANIIYT
jgi:hypothetical protein